MESHDDDDEVEKFEREQVAAFLQPRNILSLKLPSFFSPHYITVWLKSNFHPSRIYIHPHNH